MTDATFRKPVYRPGFKSYPAQLAIALLLAALADWLFFRHSLGLNVPLFAACIGIATLLGNGLHHGREVLLAGGALTASLLPSIETLNVLTFVFCVAGVAGFAFSVTSRQPRSAAGIAKGALILLVSGPCRFFTDARKFRARTVDDNMLSDAWRWCRALVLPLLLGALFLWLFAQANPVIEDVLRSLAFDPAAQDLDAWRITFWLAALLSLWSFIRIRHFRQKPPAGSQDSGQDNSVVALFDLIEPRTSLISLIVFNLIFAAQTGLDLTYLWGGVELPDGMTYSEYAYRGIQPLMAAALLSAAFVLAAFRPDTANERIPAIRALVFLWLGQNILLVISSALRLNLYIEAYTLTWLRLVGFAWMWLVAAGLFLIVVRITFHRTNAWLIAANIATTVATAYLCSFVDFDAVIARYNVFHSREVSGSGPSLDPGYLHKLGPRAIPAIDDAIVQVQQRKLDPLRIVVRHSEDRSILGLTIIDVRQRLVRRQAKSAKNWRAWGFRDHRLARYLATYDPNHYMQERTNPHNF